MFNWNGLAVIQHSTITNNKAPADQVSGVATFGDSLTRTEVLSSIVAGNVQSDVDFVFGAVNTFRSRGYNLVGNGNAVTAFDHHDQTHVIDAGLGPLADHGGRTWTYALLAASPAIDAGDPAAWAGTGSTPAFDQRGPPFVRISDGDGNTSAVIDIGAFELQWPIPGDVNGDGAVNGLDVGPFVDVVISGLYHGAADLNEDGQVSGLNVDPFIAVVIGGSATSTQVKQESREERGRGTVSEDFGVGLGVARASQTAKTSRLAHVLRPGSKPRRPAVNALTHALPRRQGTR